MGLTKSMPLSLQQEVPFLFKDNTADGDRDLVCADVADKKINK